MGGARQFALGLGSLVRLRPKRVLQHFVLGFPMLFSELGFTVLSLERRRFHLCPLHLFLALEPRFWCSSFCLSRRTPPPSSSPHSRSDNDEKKVTIFRRFRVFSLLSLACLAFDTLFIFMYYLLLCEVWKRKGRNYYLWGFGDGSSGSGQEAS